MKVWHLVAGYIAVVVLGVWALASVDYAALAYELGQFFGEIVSGYKSTAPLPEPPQ